MKKTAIFTLAFALLFGMAHAYSPEGIDDVSHENYALNPLGVNNIKAINSSFLEAIRNRHQRYFRAKYEQSQGKGYNSLTSQRLRHSFSKSKSNVNDVQTTLKRGGPVTDRTGIRENTPYRAQRSNAKQTFRARAICYYVDGTDANAECMEANTIDGERNKVISNAYTEPQHRQNISDVNASARDLVRAAAKEARSDSETSDRINTYMKGRSSRNFFAPFYRLEFERDFR